MIAACGCVESAPLDNGNVFHNIIPSQVGDSLRLLCVRSFSLRAGSLHFVQTSLAAAIFWRAGANSLRSGWNTSPKCSRAVGGGAITASSHF